ncbi:MAG: YdeI/OmpD-associated family protein [Longimicrobiales bacterium]
MKPTFFATPAAFRRWLMRHHDSAQELWVGFYKKGSGKPSITWPEAVDQALCFGWIDGVRKSLGEDSYVTRFTPRRPGSLWSAVNTNRAQALIVAGLMHEAGLKAFASRAEKRSKQYSFEREHVALSEEQEAQFRARPRAWTFFQAQPPGYRKTAMWWVIGAKRDATRQKRLATLIADSEAGRRIGLLRRDEPRR